MLKTAPRGYPKDHPRIELLRYKGLITWRTWPPGPWLGTDGRRTAWSGSSSRLNRSSSG